jgi:hypothetical protein
MEMFSAQQVSKRLALNPEAHSDIYEPNITSIIKMNQ